MLRYFQKEPSFYARDILNYAPMIPVHLTEMQARCHMNPIRRSMRSSSKGTEFEYKIPVYYSVQLAEIMPLSMSTVQKKYLVS